MARAVCVLAAGMILGACQPEQEATDTVADGRQDGLKTSQSIPATPVRAVMPEAQRSVAVRAAVEHPERLETDLDSDERRKPLEVLMLSGIEPGWAVFDLFTAGGYYAELLSRLVGPDGEVWAHNPPEFYERFGSADLDFRLADRRLPNVTRHDRPLGDLALTPGRFDAVTAAMVFHDLFWLTDDVSAVLRALYDALKPGGVMLITDHAAPEGSGDSFARGFDGKHRIEEAHVVALMNEAGFVLEKTSDLLRNPDDDRKSAFFDPPMRGQPTDRFVLLFRKPADDLGVGD